MNHFLILYQLYNNEDNVVISNSYTFLIQDLYPTEVEQLTQIKRFVIPTTFGIRLVRCQKISLLEYNNLI